MFKTFKIITIAYFFIFTFTGLVYSQEVTVKVDPMTDKMLIVMPAHESKLISGEGDLLVGFSSLGDNQNVMHIVSVKTERGSQSSAQVRIDKEEAEFFLCDIRDVEVLSGVFIHHCFIFVDMEFVNSIISSDRTLVRFNGLLGELKQDNVKTWKEKVIELKGE